MVLSSQRVLVLVGLSGWSVVQVHGFVGWPGSADRTTFCKAYGCVLTKALPPGDLGDRQDVYRLKKLPGAVMRISISTEDQIVTDAGLEYRNVYCPSLNTAQESAALAFKKSMTDLKVVFSMNGCRKSPDPMEVVPPVLADDGQGHIYQLSCVGMRASDVDMTNMPAGLKPSTATSFEVQPKY